MASIGGVPYVAWNEQHGNASQVFVARLNASGTAWEKVGGPVNYDLSASASGPALADIGGVPYVAFGEDGLRVARLNAAGTHWEEPWRGVDATHGGINDASTGGDATSLTSVGGVPYVAWDEIDAPYYVARVARLDSSTQPFATWVQPWVGVTATSGGFQVSTNHYAVSPVVAPINNTPYVAWRESNGTTYQLRVARLNSATNKWEQPWSGVSATSGGISDPTHDASIAFEARPSLVSINNFPYVAWTDTDGTHASQARVARLDTSTFPAPTWKQEAVGVTGTDGRINQSPTSPAVSVSLASVNAAPFGVGVPYLAWVEYESAGNVFELRAARFDAGTHIWEQAWPGVTQAFGAIGETANTSERSPTLVAVGGVPYLSRQLYPDGGIRISRLEPEFISQSAAASAGGELFSVTAHTYGIPYPIGFQYGPALDAQTTTQPATAGSDTATVTRQVGTLSPNTTYEYRPFATAGAPAPLVFGPTLTFRTDASGGGSSSGSGTPAAMIATVLQERISPTSFPSAPSGPSARAAKRRTYGTRVTYVLDRAGSVRFTVAQRQPGREASHARCVPVTSRNRGGRKCTRLVTLRGSFTLSGRAGSNTFRFTGRINGKRLKPGSYQLDAMPFTGRLKGRTARVSFRIIR